MERAQKEIMELVSLNRKYMLAENEENPPKSETHNCSKLAQSLEEMKMADSSTHFKEEDDEYDVTQKRA